MHELVDVLQRKMQWLLNRTDRLLDVVKRLMERRVLVPRHVLRMRDRVVAVESGDGDKWNLVRVEPSPLEDVAGLSLDLVVLLLG